MIKSITIENFMSHQATRIELAPGVTVITGPNNVGKSALVEGVRSLVHNPSPKNSIRHGAKQAVIRLELDSGEIIEWVRSDKTAFYRLSRPAAGEPAEARDIEEYHKIGQSVPEDIVTLLRLGQVETESGEIDIHIGNQREPIFLLNSPGSYAASFFAASTEAEHLLRMRQALKSRVDVARSNSKTLAIDCKVAEKNLLHYQPLDLLEPEVIKAENSFELIRQNQKSIPELARFIQVLSDKEDDFRSCHHSAAILETVKPPPQLQDVTDLEALLDQLREKEERAGLAAATSLCLAPLSDPPVPLDTAALEHLIGRLADADRLRERLKEDRGILADLKEPMALQPAGDLEDGIRAIHRLEVAFASNLDRSNILNDIHIPPVIQDLTAFEQLLDDLSFSELRKNRVRRQQEGLASLASPPDLYDVTHLLRLIDDISHSLAAQRFLKAICAPLSGLSAAPEPVSTMHLENLTGEIAGIIDQLYKKDQERRSLEEVLQQKRHEVEQLVQETGICPLCGSPMDVSHFLEAMHD